MKTEQKFIAESIRAFLGHHSTKKLSRLFEAIDFLKLNTIIDKQNIAGYFYHLYLNKVFESLNIPADTFETWKRASGRNLIANELNDSETIKMSKEQKKLFCVDNLLPFEYSFYKSMVFKLDGTISDRTALRIIKILLPYKMSDLLRVIKDNLKFMWRNKFNGKLA